jgi:hypothetical protein
MKNYLHNVLAATFLLLVSTLSIAQAPPMGTAADFVLFTSVGAMQNVGTYQYLTLLTGNVGTNSGSNTNFGNVNGVMHAGDGASDQCAYDLGTAYDFLEAAIPDSTIVNPVLGNDSTFEAGTYLLPSTTSLDLSITMDAQGNPDAVFIFKMPAGPPTYAFSTSANAQVNLINGAQACNVFWYVTGAVSIGTETSMKGTIVAGGAISMAPGSELEGRALTINGAVTVTNGDIGLLAYLPVDIAATLPTGPAAPVFVESEQYAIFSTIGDVSDDGTSHVAGSVGGNSASPTGYNPLFVSGNIDGMNPATAGAAADLILVYNSLNTLTADIELLAPDLFGHNLVLTPHCYIMNEAVTFTDTLILDARGNEDAVFIIKTYGAFASGVNSKVVLKNGTQAKNIFWMVNGAVSISDYSVFKGNIIANNGAIDLLIGTCLEGRALTTDGAISTVGMTTVLPDIPADLIIQNDTVANSEIEFFIATNTIVAAGNNTTVVFESGSTADLIAGTSVTLLPGFHAKSGSNVHIYISPAGPFCEAQPAAQIQPIVYKSIAIDKEENTIDVSEKLLKVYPNPNDGKFTITTQNFNSNIDVKVFNLSGKMIHYSNGLNGNNAAIEINSSTSGLYYVRVSDGETVKTAKIIIR